LEYARRLPYHIDHIRFTRRLPLLIDTKYDVNKYKYDVKKNNIVKDDVREVEVTKYPSSISIWLQISKFYIPVLYKFGYKYPSSISIYTSLHV